MRTVSSTTSGAKKPIPRDLSRLKNSLATGNQRNVNGAAKPAHDALSGYDARLVDMINTVIVDRSPAVKWDDVGKNLQDHIPFYAKLFSV